MIPNNNWIKNNVDIHQKALNDERLKNFKDLEFTKKQEQLISFYETMIKKTQNDTFKQKFQKTIDTIKWYTENQSDKLITLFTKILEAEYKTKEKREIKKQKEIEEWTKKLEEAQKKKERIKEQERLEHEKDVEDAEKLLEQAYLQ